VNTTGHFIQNDDPDLVVWSIRRVLEAEPPPPEVSLPRSTLEEYVGVYGDGPETGFTVTLEGSQLFARYASQGPLAIFAESESRFYYRAVDARITFQRNAAGQVIQLVLHQNGRDR
ncbi:MAG: DUF3471 domain-containing protein, partial [Actinobacteria bacterium]|nr:DUF3471 domain-containing protein [Actinomycetota bacterium]NIX25177.1 DUF3471 domain-containing protein [Actinomycetota bacterium]